MINGLVDRELIFTLDDLRRFRKQTVFIFWNVQLMAGWNGRVPS